MAELTHLPWPVALEAAARLNAVNDLLRYGLMTPNTAAAYHDRVKRELTAAAAPPPPPPARGVHLLAITGRHCHAFALPNWTPAATTEVGEEIGRWWDASVNFPHDHSRIVQAVERLAFDGARNGDRLLVESANGDRLWLVVITFDTEE